VSWQLELATRFLVFDQFRDGQLVALPSPRDLLLRAKLLFVAARGRGFTGASRRIGKSEHDGGPGRVSMPVPSAGAARCNVPPPGPTKAGNAGADFSVTRGRPF
jgi:hypothetical protein